MEQSDQYLIDEFRKTGRLEFLEELLQRHLRPIRTAIFQMVLDHNIADDLTQDVLLKVVRGIEQFEGRSEFATWLFRIAMNTVRSHLKQHNRSRVFFDHELPDNTSIRENMPDSSIIQAELTSDIQTALSQLPPQLRAAIVLTGFQGKSASEAADIEDCSTDTMHWRVHEARRQLKQLLAEHL